MAEAAKACRQQDHCPVQVKVAKSRRRLRVNLQSPELPCEIGRPGRHLGHRVWQPLRSIGVGSQFQRPASALK
jgi:hypothetical protein